MIAHDWRTYVYVVKKNTPRLENHLAEFKVPLQNFNNGSGSKDDECRCVTRVRRTMHSHLPFIGLNRSSRIMCIYDAYVIAWYCMCIYIYINLLSIKLVVSSNPNKSTQHHAIGPIPLGLSAVPRNWCCSRSDCRAGSDHMDSPRKWVALH